MELILLIIYSVIVWLIFFKFKLLPWNITSQVIVVTIPIFALTVLILFMNICAPSSSDVRAQNYVIPIVPRVTGQVTEVPIEPNRPIKKGDVLFKIDPVPFEAAANAAEATLRGAKDQLSNSPPWPQLGPGSGPTSNKRKATSVTSKANSLPLTPRNRRPKHRSKSLKRT